MVFRLSSSSGFSVNVENDILLSAFGVTWLKVYSYFYHDAHRHESDTLENQYDAEINRIYQAEYYVVKWTVWGPDNNGRDYSKDWIELLALGYKAVAGSLLCSLLHC